MPFIVYVAIPLGNVHTADFKVRKNLPRILSFFVADFVMHLDLCWFQCGKVWEFWCRICMLSVRKFIIGTGFYHDLWAFVYIYQLKLGLFILCYIQTMHFSGMLLYVLMIGIQGSFHKRCHAQSMLHFEICHKHPKHYKPNHVVCRAYILDCGWGMLRWGVYAADFP